METVFDFVPVKDDATPTTKCSVFTHGDINNNKNNNYTYNIKNSNGNNNNNNNNNINNTNTISNKQINNNINVKTELKKTHITTAARNNTSTHTDTTTTKTAATTSNNNNNTTTSPNNTTSINTTTTTTNENITNTTTYKSNMELHKTSIDSLTAINFYEKTTKDRIIVLATEKGTFGTKIRLERIPGTFLKEEVLHTSGKGVFKDVMVIKAKKRNLVRVGKPHAHVILYVHAHKHSLGQELVKEKREVSLWFYRGVEGRRKLASLFIKSLIKPECFPSDLLGFIKKTLFLMRRIAQLKRVEIQSCDVADDDVKDDVADDPFIENFITVLTPAKYDYQYLPEVPVSRKSHICFRVMAAADAHVALSYMYGDTDRKTYEVVIGGRGNTTCAIKYGGQGDVKTESYTPNVLKSDDFQTFWIGWNDNAVKVGRGKQCSDDILVVWADIPQEMRHKVHLISVSTGPPSTGTWEFVELIPSDGEKKVDRKELMRRVVKGIIWWGKKEKIIQQLEEAFPTSLDLKEIMRLSTISIAKMLEAVVFLKKTTEDRLVIEVDKGRWMRWPFHPSEPKQDIIRNPILQSFLRNKEPTIGIISSLFIEKTAMDCMMDGYDFIIIETENKKHTVAYTIGLMGNKSVVCMKLPSMEDPSNSKPSHVFALETMLKHFKSIEHILVVGVGGGVPNFEDADKHIRRGDVVLSYPRDSDGAIYVQTTSVSHDLLADPTGDSASYVTSCWNAEKYGPLQKRIKSFFVKNDAWQRYLNCASEKLTKYDQRFNRPAMKTDKVFYQPHKNQPAIPMEHPTNHQSPSSRMHLGTIGSGSNVATDLFYRRIFAKNNSVSAFDVGLSHVMQAIYGSRIKRENVTIVLGVSDYCDGNSTKSWQPYSSLAACAVCKAFIQTL